MTSYTGSVGRGDPLPILENEMDRRKRGEGGEPSYTSPYGQSAGGRPPLNDTEESRRKVAKFGREMIAKQQEVYYTPPPPTSLDQPSMYVRGQYHPGGRPPIFTPPPQNMGGGRGMEGRKTNFF